MRLFFCKIHLRLNDTYSLPSFRFWSALHWNLICWVGAAVCNLYGKVAIATTKWSQHRFFIDSHWTGLFYLILFPYILLVLCGVCVCVFSLVFFDFSFSSFLRHVGRSFPFRIIEIDYEDRFAMQKQMVFGYQAHTHIHIFEMFSYIRNIKWQNDTNSRRMFL